MIHRLRLPIVTRSCDCRQFARLLIACILPGLAACQATSGAVSGVSQIERMLPRLGHRNFIVIADSAYPLQVSPGVQTAWVREGHVELLDRLLEAIRKQGHVRPIIWLDSELDHVSEANATGIGELRSAFARRLTGMDVRKAPHEGIIRKLDETARLFQVLVLKTDLKLPYTSVFIELQCGYWTSQAEKELRQTMTEYEARQR